MAKQLTPTQKEQHQAVLNTVLFNLQNTIDAIETLNTQANYDNLLEYLDSAKTELANITKKLV